MELQPDDSPVSYKINQVGNHTVTIDNTEHKLPLLCTLTEVQPLPISSPQLLTPQHMATWCRELSPELILIGTGPTHLILPEEIIHTCYLERIGCEVMSSPSACRTHSILMSEQRPFVLLLFGDDVSNT